MLEPIAPARYRVQFTASQAFHDKLTRLKGLLRSQVPDGDLAAVLEIAVAEKLARVEARRFGTTDRPRKTVDDVNDAGEGRRAIPMPIRRAVFERDGGQCTYTDQASGRRCSATEDLEFHHIVPWAVCREHKVENLCLYCHGHNAYQAELDFGAEHMARFRRGRAKEPRAPYGVTTCAAGEVGVRKPASLVVRRTAERGRDGGNSAARRRPRWYAPSRRAGRPSSAAPAANSVQDRVLSDRSGRPARREGPTASEHALIRRDG